MKKTLLITYILSICLGIGLNAQVVDGNGGRLDVGTKNKNSATSKLLKQTFKLDYQPISVRENLALREYYKTLLYPKSATESGFEEQALASLAVVAVDKKTPVMESRSLSNSEKLYFSERITVSNIYPNPANGGEKVRIDYAIGSGVASAKITLYNLLGSTVADYSLDKNDTKLEIPTRDITAGVYFYQLSIDGKKVATKKLLVRHQQ